MKIEMEKQTKTIFDKMNEKLEPLIEDNKIMKSKIENFEKKIGYLEKENQRFIIWIGRKREVFYGATTGSTGHFQYRPENYIGNNRGIKNLPYWP